MTDTSHITSTAVEALRAAAEPHAGRGDDCGQLARAVIEALAAPTVEPKKPVSLLRCTRCGWVKTSKCLDTTCDECGCSVFVPDAVLTEAQIVGAARGAGFQITTRRETEQLMRLARAIEAAAKGRP